MSLAVAANISSEPQKQYREEKENQVSNYLVNIVQAESLHHKILRVVNAAFESGCLSLPNTVPVGSSWVSGETCYRSNEQC